MILITLNTSTTNGKERTEKVAVQKEDNENNLNDDTATFPTSLPLNHDAATLSTSSTGNSGDQLQLKVHPLNDNDQCITQASITEARTDNNDTSTGLNTSRFDCFLQLHVPVGSVTQLQTGSCSDVGVLAWRRNEGGQRVCPDHHKLSSCPELNPDTQGVTTTNTVTSPYHAQWNRPVLCFNFAFVSASTNAPGLKVVFLTSSLGYIQTPRHIKLRYNICAILTPPPGQVIFVSANESSSCYVAFARFQSPCGPIKKPMRDLRLPFIFPDLKTFVEGISQYRRNLVVSDTEDKQNWNGTRPLTLLYDAKYVRTQCLGLVFSFQQRRPVSTSNQWNCSKSEWPELYRHFSCDGQLQCLGDEDETHCYYHSDDCGAGKAEKRYDLKDTDGLSVEELKEIPFVKVETKASLFKLKYSPKLRQKVKAAKQKSLGELDQNRNQLTKKPNSGPVDDETEQEMSVHSQPLPTKGSGNRNTVDYSQSEVGHSRVSRRPLSYHQPQSHTSPTDNDSAPSVSVRPHSHLSSPPPYDSDADNRMKAGHSIKAPNSNIPSELSYQPSQSSHLVRSPQGRFGALNSEKQHDSDSRSSHVNHVTQISRSPSDNYVRLSDVRSPKGSWTAPQYGRSPSEKPAPVQTCRSPPKRVDRGPSDLECSPQRPVASASSSRSDRTPHRDTVHHAHPRSQSAYDSDINTHSQRRRDRPQDRTEVTTQADPPRYSSRYWREQDDFGYNGGVRAEAEYERLHPHPVVDSWREGSRSGQRGEGWVKSGYQYREDSSQQSHYAGPPHTSQGAPLYEDRRPGNTSYSSVTSPPQSYHHHHHHHQHLHPPPVSSYASTQSYNYAPSYSSPLSNSHHDQGQRPRSYGQQQDERPRSALHQYEEYRVREEQDRSKSYGSEEGQVTRYQGEGDRSRSSFRDVRPRHPRSPYPEETPQQHYDYQRQTGYQQAAPYQNSTHQYRHPSPQPHNSRTHGTPPRSQGTPPRHQGPPPQYPGTPPRYQGTPSKQSVSSTPPRQNVDPRYSQGRLSVHAREHSEGGSSQASARGAGNFHRSARPSQGAVGSLRSEHRSMGNSLTPEQARQLLKSSSYNPDLCTEL
ncbi:uncharacterized protein LOC143282312 [Babylonia areolata]|uniref:uncharacterized protein LOC143282312 n=1 Tax=Babylonia areolata TaxID=304850 RepID=UPI003FCF2D12